MKLGSNKGLNDVSELCNCELCFLYFGSNKKAKRLVRKPCKHILSDTFLDHPESLFGTSFQEQQSALLPKLTNRRILLVSCPSFRHVSKGPAL